MKKNNKTNTPDNLSTVEQLREFREKNPLPYLLEAKIRRKRFAKTSVVDNIADELESYLNEGPRHGEDKEIFELVQQEAMFLRQIIEEIRQARVDGKLERLENLCYDLAIQYQNSFLYQDRTEALMSDYSRKKSANAGLAESLKKRTAGKKDKLAELTHFIQQVLSKDPKISNKVLLRQVEAGGYDGNYTESSLAKHIKDIASKERKEIKNNN
jgi:hypothetical protein